MTEDYRNKVDTNRCHFCAKQKDIEVHHIVPQRFNGSDKRENLVAVCDRCHEKLEALYDKRFYEVLGVADEADERKNHFSCQKIDCTNQATVKMGKVGYPSSWSCLYCATEYVDNMGAENLNVQEDITGKFATRREWLESSAAYNADFSSLRSVSSSNQEGD